MPHEAQYSGNTSCSNPKWVSPKPKTKDEETTLGNTLTGLPVSQVLTLPWLAYASTVLESNALPVLKYVKRNIDRAAANRAAAANKVGALARQGLPYLLGRCQWTAAWNILTCMRVNILACHSHGSAALCCEVSHNNIFAFTVLLLGAFS